jgi:hypothetical protein
VIFCSLCPSRSVYLPHSFPICLCLLDDTALRWARQYLPRTRLYHQRRLRAAWQLQQAVRQSQARLQLLSRRRHWACLRLQCAWRQHRARLRRRFLWLTRAAVAVQSAARRWLAGRRAHRVLLALLAARLAAWYRRRKQRWRRSSARRLQR